MTDSSEMTTETYLAAPGIDLDGNPDDAEEAEIRRLEREWTEAASSLTRWALVANGDPSARTSQDTGYRLAWRAIGAEHSYLRAVRTRNERVSRGEALAPREARLKRQYDEARRSLQTIVAIGAGLGHVILAGCGCWRPLALVPASEPLESRLRNAAIQNFRNTADAWRSHVEFTLAARRGHRTAARSDEPAIIAIGGTGCPGRRTPHTARSLAD